MPRLPVGPHLSAALAILISTAGCSGGSATGGEGGSPGSGGTGGTATSRGGASGTGPGGASGGAPSGGTGGSVSGGTAGAGAGGATSNAGAGGATSNAGAGGATSNASAGGSVATGGAGGAGTTCLANDIDLRATTVSGTFTLNGGAVTAPTAKGVGSIVLRRDNDSALLGSTSASGGAYAALVFPGTYDLYYMRDIDRTAPPGTTVPSNALAKLRSGIVVGASPLKVDVDVTATKVSGTVTINGAAVTGASANLGAVSLVNAAGDSAVLSDLSSAGSYAALVVPGTYDLYYTGLQSGPPLPANTSAKLQTGVVVGTSPLSLNIDVPAPTVSATVTINGAAVTGAAKGQWVLTLEDAAGARAQLTTYSSASGAFSGRVIPGTYDLYWTSGHADVPGNTSAKIKSGIVVGTSAVSLSVDIPSTTISGTVTLAGAAPTVLAGELPYVTLRGAAGDTAPLLMSATGTYSAHVIPGTYDLYFGLNGSGALNSAPRNSSAKLQSAIVVGAAPVSLNIDIPATPVSGTATLNGAAITTTAQRAFVLTLQNVAGDRAQLASYPQGGAFSASLIPGTYDLYYTRGGDIGVTIPNNIATKLRSGIVVGASPLALDVDIRGTTVSGAITVNGVATGVAGDDSAFLGLFSGESDPNSGALLTSAVSATGTYSTFVLPGAYELYYVRYRSGSTLPVNTNAHLGCFVVP